MTASIDTLITTMTADEILAELIALLAALGIPTTSWQEGQPLLTLLSTVSQELSNFTIVTTDITKGGFGDLLPSDEWADVWAQSRFNEDRIEAQPATGLVNLPNSSVTQYDKLAGEVIIANSVTGKLYRNVNNISILATTGLNNVAVSSDELGTGSNASPGTVTKLVTSMVGVTVTNPLPILGVDRETTPQLVVRCRSKLASFSPDGPKDAYAFVAKTHAYSATSVPITRVNVVPNYTDGTIISYLATASGAPSGPDIVIVQAAQDQWSEPWLDTNVATAATEVSQAITYIVYVRGSSLTDPQIKSAIADSLSVFFSILPIGGSIIPPAGGKLYREEIRQAIAVATPGIQSTTISLPAADLSMTADQVMTLGTITGTVIRL